MKFALVLCVAALGSQKFQVYCGHHHHHHHEDKHYAVTQVPVYTPVEVEEAPHHHHIQQHEHVSGCQCQQCQPSHPTVLVEHVKGCQCHHCKHGYPTVHLEHVKGCQCQHCKHGHSIHHHEHVKGCQCQHCKHSHSIHHHEHVKGCQCQHCMHGLHTIQHQHYGGCQCHHCKHGLHIIQHQHYGGCQCHHCQHALHPIQHQHYGGCQCHQSQYGHCGHPMRDSLGATIHTSYSGTAFEPNECGKPECIGSYSGSNVFVHPATGEYDKFAVKCRTILQSLLDFISRPVEYGCAPGSALNLDLRSRIVNHNIPCRTVCLGGNTMIPVLEEKILGVPPCTTEIAPIEIHPHMTTECSPCSTSPVTVIPMEVAPISEPVHHVHVEPAPHFHDVVYEKPVVEEVEGCEECPKEMKHHMHHMIKQMKHQMHHQKKHHHHHC